jgi:hypothetical protein
VEGSSTFTVTRNTSSVLVCAATVVENAPPRTGTLDRPGTPRLSLAVVSVMNPPTTAVSWLRRVTVVRARFVSVMGAVSCPSGEVTVPLSSVMAGDSESFVVRSSAIWTVISRRFPNDTVLSE